MGAAILDRIHSATPAERASPRRPGRRLVGRWIGSRNVRDYALSLGVVAASTVASAVVFPRGSTTDDVVMVYLLGIVFIALRCGLRPSLLVSVLSVLSFDFFFIKPYYSFAVSDLRHIPTFGVMFVVAVVIGRLAERTRAQAAAAEQRESRTSQLYAFTRELSRLQDVDALLRTAHHHLESVFQATVVAMLPDATGALRVAVQSGGNVELSQADAEAADYAWSHLQRAGFGTERCGRAMALWLPLATLQEQSGVLGLFPEGDSNVQDPSWRDHLEAFATQLSMALERAHLAQQRQAALLEAEAEKLRSSLLSSVSHDLRTPLAVMTGAASTLLDPDGETDEATRGDLLRAIWEEGERLNRLIHNLLHMTRVESKSVHVKKEWQPLEEIVGAVLGRLERTPGARPVIAFLPPDLPPVAIDAVLIEQVLLNLLDNAFKYAVGGDPIELTAHAEPDAVVVEVTDCGPGISPGEEELVFEKFHRSPHVAASGAGLGLAICRGIVTAHGGRISVENRKGGGARFAFTLPMSGCPLPADVQLEN